LIKGVRVVRGEEREKKAGGTGSRKKTQVGIFSMTQNGKGEFLKGGGGGEGDGKGNAKPVSEVK